MQHSFKGIWRGKAEVTEPSWLVPTFEGFSMHSWKIHCHPCGSTSLFIPAITQPMEPIEALYSATHLSLETPKIYPKPSAPHLKYRNIPTVSLPTQFRPYLTPPRTLHIPTNSDGQTQLRYSEVTILAVCRASGGYFDTLLTANRHVNC